MSSNGSVDTTVGYLKVTGINGESQDEGFQNWVKVVGWSWSGTGGSSVGQTSGSGGAGKVSHAALSVRVYLDAAGPEFWDMMNKGTHKQGLSLVIMRLGQGKKAFMIDMQEIYCSAHSVVHQTIDALPELSVSFTWGIAKVEYYKQDAQGNTVSTGAKTFDATKNKPS